MRRTLLAVAALAWPVATAAAALPTHQVTIEDNRYLPPEVTIDVGDSVRWTNRGLTPHSVTFRSGTSYDVLPGDSKSQQFLAAGTYRYFCRFHEDEMEGTVVVRATTGSTLRTTTTTEPPEGSARTGSPDTSTTTTSTTTTTLLDDEGTTTTAPADSPSGQAGRPLDGDDGGDVDGPAAVAALLLLATGGGAFLLTRTTVL